MSLVFLAVNSVGAVTYANYGQPNWMVDHSSFLTWADDGNADVKALTTNVNAYTYAQVMGTAPYLTAHYDGTNVNVTLNNPPATPPTSATLTVLGTTYTVAFTNNAFSFPLSVHASVANQRVTASIQVSGCPYIYVECGGMNADIQTQMYKDSGGVSHVVPYKNADLGAYWTAQSFPAVWQPADIATIVGLLMELTTKMATALQSATYTPITLDSNQQNALNDIINNLVPKIPVNLGSAAPVPASGSAQTYNGHYNSYRTHFLDSGSAMSNYAQDVTNITAYVPLH